MIKGVTTIELTDIKSGETKKVSESNFFTNAYRDLCQPKLRNHEQFSSLYSAFNRGSIGINDLLGGILLFDDYLEENPDNYFPPLTVNNIGHGAEITYTGSDLSLGSFNVSQSDLVSENKRKFVWDFTAEQANGNISSVCLTTRCGGIIGHGTTTPCEANEKYERMVSNFKLGVIKAMLPVTKSTYIPIYLSFKDDYILILDYDSLNRRAGKITFYKIKLMSNNADIFLKTYPVSSVYSNESLYNYVGEGYTSCEKIEIDLSSVIGKYYYYGYAQEGKYLYISTGSDTMSSTSGCWPPNESITFVKIDLETLTYTTFSVTNTTGVNIYLYGSISTISRGHTFAVSNGYMFVSSFNGVEQVGMSSIYAIRLSDNTEVHQVETITGEKKVAYSDYYQNIFLSVIRGEVHFSYDKVITDISYKISPIRCVSTNDFIAKSKGTPSQGFVGIGGPTSGSGSWYVCPTDNDLYYLYSEMKNNSSNNIDVYLSFLPNVLMTINNLSSPVTKTSAQTMRISYTVTKEDSNQ